MAYSQVTRVTVHPELCGSTQPLLTPLWLCDGWARREGQLTAAQTTADSQRMWLGPLEMPV